MSTAYPRLLGFMLASMIVADPSRANTVVGPSQLLEVTATSGINDPGLVTVQSGGTLELSGINGPIVTVPNNLSLDGNGFDGAQGAVWVSGPNMQATLSGAISVPSGALITSAGTLNVTGPISGAGVAFGGTGVIALSGANSFFGSVAIENGTLRLDADNTLPAGSSLVMIFGTVDLNGHSQTIQSLEGSPNPGPPTSLVLSGSAVLTVSGWSELPPHVAHAPATVVISGTGGIVKTGANGLLILTGANTYTGGTTLDDGDLAITSDANLGAPSGTLTLNGGRLDIGGNVVSSRTITLGGSATIVAASSTSSVISGEIGGYGSLTFAGLGSGPSAGSLTLSGSNVYSGGTIITGGRLVVGAPNALTAGPVEVDRGVLDINGFTTTIGSLSGSSDGTIALSDGAVLSVGGGSYAGNFTGSGRLTFGGVTTLSGVNSATGGTFVAGNLTVSSDAALGAPGVPLSIGPSDTTLSLAGNVVSSRPILINPGAGNNIAGFTTIQWAAGTSSVLSGPISGGVGFLNFVGSGNGSLTLAGDNSFFSLLSWHGGTIVVANPHGFGQSLVSMSDGMLETDGVNRTIIIGGNYSQGSGTLLLRLYAPGQSDQLIVQGGQASLGGTLELVPAPGYVPRPGPKTILITATGGILGEFATVVTPPALDAKIDYESNTVSLDQLSFVPFATTPNQAAVAAAIDRGVAAGVGGDFDVLLGTLDALPTDASIAAALDQLSPQRYQLFRRIAFDQSDFLASTVGSWLEADRAGGPPIDLSGLSVERRSEGALGMQVRRTMAGLAPAAFALDSPDAPLSVPRGNAGGISAFVSGTVVTANVNAAGGIAKSDFTTGGVVAGLAWHPDDAWALGLLLAYGHTDATLDGEGSKGRVDSYAPGLFVAYAAGGLHGQAVLAWQAEDYTMSRRVLVGTLDRTAHGDPSGDAPTAAIGVGYDWFDEGLRFGPTLDAIYTRLSIDPFAESGAGSAGLAIGGLGATSFRTRLGGHVALTTEIAGMVLRPDINLAWQREFAAGGDPISAAFEGLATPGFAVSTASLRGDSLFGGFHVSGAVSDSTALFVGYQVQTGNGETAHDVVAGLKIAL